MALKKLGEILVAGQLLQPGDLKKALDAQLIFGGRLGTNLLELGYLDEQQLSNALEQQTSMKVATPAMLEKATPEAIRMIPPKVAAKHRVVPFKLESKKLHVAMLDPTDLIVLDELSFVTGCQVVGYVTPEVRLLTYLEQHYDVSRPMRYIKLAEPDQSPTSPGLDSRSLAAQFTAGQLDMQSGGQSPEAAAAAADAARKAGITPEGATPQGEPVLSLDELLGTGTGEGAIEEAAEKAAEKLETVTPEALRNVETASAEQRAVMDAALEKLKEKRTQEAIAAAESDEAKVATLEDAARLLAEAETREDIGEALLGFMRSQFPRVMLYVVQRDRALGWLAHLPGRSPDQARTHARRVVVPLGEPSVLQGVAQTGQYYMGELPARAGDQSVASALGDPRPANMVILPVKLSDKAVILLQGDNLDQPLSNFRMRDLRAACQKAGLAMEVLLLRSKIRQV